MDFNEQNNNENQKFLNINETESNNCFNEAPPIQFYNDINDINNEKKNTNSEYEQTKITDSGNEPQNSAEQSFPIFDKPQNQQNLDNLNNLNIPKNVTPNQIYIPSPYTNVENNEPIVISQYDNIQQNIGINQNPNYYLNNQPFPNYQIPYQAQNPQPNNVASLSNECCCCIGCTACGILLLIFIFFIFY